MTSTSPIARSLALTAVLSGAAAAQFYDVTDLGDLGSNASWAWALNDAGQVTGWSVDGLGRNQAYGWTAESGMKGLGFPQGTSASYGIGVNASGWIVGYGGLAFEDSQAFVRPPGGQLQVLPDLGGDEAWARDVNDLGQIVGESKVPGGELHAATWQGGVITDLSALLGSSTSNADAISDTGFVVGRADGEPYLLQGSVVTFLPTLGANGIPNDVNDAGVAVGSSWKSVGVGCTFCDNRAVMWKDGRVIELGVLASPTEPMMSSSAYGINELGQVVGQSTIPVLGSLHGFVWDAAGGMRDLDDLVPAGWSISSAYAINDLGQIVASGSFAGGSPRALLLTPELPASYCTAGVSASGCQAAISAVGDPSATSASGFSLLASGVEGAKDGLFFFGTSGRQANPWGNGSSYQCVAPPVTRAGLLGGAGTGGQCDGAFSQDLNALWCAACPSPGKNPGAGAVVQAQLWYRDPLSTGNQTTSLSDAIEFLVAP